MGAGLFLTPEDGLARGGPPPRGWWRVPVLRQRVLRRAAAPVVFAAVALPTLWVGRADGRVGPGAAVALAVAVLAVAALGLSGVLDARRELARLLDGQAARWPYRRDGGELLLSPLDRRAFRVRVEPSDWPHLGPAGALWVRGELLGGPAVLLTDDGARLWLLDGGARIVDR